MLNMSDDQLYPVGHGVGQGRTEVAFSIVTATSVQWYNHCTVGVCLLGASQTYHMTGLVLGNPVIIYGTGQQCQIVDRS